MGQGDSAASLHFNWYGNLFNRNDFIGAFRNSGTSHDLEGDYCTPLSRKRLDCRLFLAGYGFNTDPGVYGVRAGAELTTRDRLLVAR